MTSKKTYKNSSEASLAYSNEIEKLNELLKNLSREISCHVVENGGLTQNPNIWALVSEPNMSIFNDHLIESLIHSEFKPIVQNSITNKALGSAAKMGQLFLSTLDQGIWLKKMYEVRMMAYEISFVKLNPTTGELILAPVPAPKLPGFDSNKNSEFSLIAQIIKKKLSL